MDNDQKFWLRIWSVIIAGALLLVLTLSFYTYYEKKLHVLNGYEETMVIGKNYPIWKKVQ